MAGQDEASTLSMSTVILGWLTWLWCLSTHRMASRFLRDFTAGLSAEHGPHPTRPAASSTTLPRAVQLAHLWRRLSSAMRARVIACAELLPALIIFLERAVSFSCVARAELR